jgi:hypothetical protein
VNEIIIHPIYALAAEWCEAPFDLTLLPFDVCDGIAIEDVSELFSEKTFSWVGDGLGRGDQEILSGVRHALVRRQEIENDHIVVGPHGSQKAEPIEAVMACLRIVRPMRERLGIMRGEVRRDGTLNIKRFGVPYNVINVPDVEKLFTFRTQDAMLLRMLAPRMLRATSGAYWKVRMATEFYQLGHFQQLHWKSRIFSRCSAIEAVFSSKSRRGSGIVKDRIKAFLGEHTCIYDQGDIPSYHPQARDITIGSILDYIYEVRNCLAHGDKLPDYLFGTILRQGIAGPLNVIAVVDEAVSFIARKSIQRILADDLLEEFRDSDSADRYFDA